jgi:hypothetical protein
LVAGKDQARYGEPIQADADEDDVAELARTGNLQVRVSSGSDALSAIPTDRIEAVNTLLSPLDTKEVPILICVGLNYKSHSKQSPALF